MSGTPTRRWRGIVAIVLVSAAVGVLADRPALFYLAGIGVVFAVYPAVARVPDPQLTIERAVSNAAPADGEIVTIDVTITNVGQTVLPDLRVVDGVPPALRVVDGSPRAGMTLYPTRSSTFSYTVTARRGRHVFEPTTVVARDVSGALERVVTVTTDTELDCSTSFNSVGSGSQPRMLTGEVPTNEGGSGIEFHQTREYRHGDPINRIDWNRFARTRDLTTIEFDEARSIAVVILVDARKCAYHGHTDRPHAVAQCVSAARQLVAGLHSGRNWVGIAGIGRTLCWRDPGAGRDHLADVDRLLRTHETFSTVVPDATTGEADQFVQVRKRLGPSAQLIVCSPLCDDDIVDACRRIRADGAAVTVISPDVTLTETPGGTLASLQRTNRIATLLRDGVQVIDWSPSEDLANALNDDTMAVA